MNVTHRPFKLGVPVNCMGESFYSAWVCAPTLLCVVTPVHAGRQEATLGEVRRERSA